ncbi:PTS sugar transporter subunit IIA [Snodgrassella sp. CFCC 13594]|uniref:PTS sugar transporter subunit IIA n=1 Tax=Snodgrassella sp. CFCC 13594 TaxID=1775559 RepID=UPI0008374EBD|nr:PTS mannose transporter subunit IIA [Snodgrassella sp. CFCC 13594]
MIGLMIVTHETLGQAYTQLAEHIFGAMPENVAILSVRQDDQPEAVRAKALVLLAQLDEGHGVLVLTDIFGATPCNVARNLIHNDKMVMITGLNAPMMVKAMQYAKESNDLLTLAAEVKRAAISGILTITYDDVNDK